jgi:hypothetical protein
MIKLTEQQAEALNSEKPLRLVHPHNGQIFVVVRQELYESMRKWGESLNQAGWDDPALDIYEEYRNQP